MVPMSARLPLARLLVCLALAVSMAFPPLTAAAGCACCGTVPVSVALGGGPDRLAAEACCGGACGARADATAPAREGDDPATPDDDAGATPGACDHCGCPGCHRPPVMHAAPLPRLAAAPPAALPHADAARPLGRAPVPPTQPPRA